MPPIHNHVFSLAFTVVSQDEAGADVTEEQLFQAVLVRLLDLRATGEGQIREAAGPAEDSHETTPEAEAWRRPLIEKARVLLAQF